MFVMIHYFQETPAKLRVFFCGAHSTGKTTLLHDVEKLVRIKAIPEVARQLIKVKSIFVLCYN